MVEVTSASAPQIAAKKTRPLKRRILLVSVLVAIAALPYFALAAWCGSFERANRFVAGERLFVETESETIRTDGDHHILVRRIRVRNMGFEPLKIVGFTRT